MVEIITEDVKMPPMGERKFQKDPTDLNGNKWKVVDDKKVVVYEGKFEKASLICHNLNKKHYRTIQSFY